MHLQTKRLLLREFTQDDWPAVLAYQSRPAYQHLYPNIVGTEEQARDFVGRFLQWWQEMPRLKYQWAVVLPAQDRPIGNCGIRKSEPDARDAEIGCELAAEHWGRGYPAELGTLLFSFGFEELNLHRIYAHCLADNRSAVALAESLACAWKDG